MLDDSISSSPTQNERSIYVSRMHRKNRRRRIIKDKDQSTEANDGSGTTKNEPTQEYNEKWFNCTWEEELNKSSELDTTFIQSRDDIPDFDPFFDEKLLVMADHLDNYQKHHQTKRHVEHLLADQGFINCTQLMEMEAKMRPPETSTTVLNNATQFGLSETELFNCCAEVENQVRATSIEEPRTKPTTEQKSVVETILEDFDCSIEESFNEEANRNSLCMDQNNQHISPKSSPLQEDRTPKFRIDNKPIRTYSRQDKVNTTRGNIANIFEARPITKKEEEEEDNISCCSSHLSTTEDLNQLPNSPNHSDDHNEFINLSGNLLKLTATLSQKCMADATLDFESNAEDNKTLMEAVKCLENNSGTISSESIIALGKKCTDGIEEAPTTSKSVAVISPKNIDTTRNDKAIDEEDIFKGSEDEDEWNDDCNFFKNFHTQDVFWGAFNTNKDKCKRPHEYQGFMTASQKPITISDTAKQRAAHILAAVDAELENEFQATQNISVSKRLRKGEMKTNQLSVMPRDHFRMPLTSVKKSEPKDSSNKRELHQPNAHDLGNIQLSEWFIDETSESVGENQILYEQSNSEKREQTSTPSIEPFSKMTDKSLESTDILREEKRENIHQSDSLFRDKIISKISEKSSPGNCSGFFTASQKPIKISAQALEKAALIFKTLPDFPKGIPNELSSLDENEGLSEVEEKHDQCKIKRKSAPENTTEQSPKIFCKSQSAETSSILRTTQTSNNNYKPSASVLDSFSHIIPHKENFILTSCLKPVTPSRKNLLTLGKQKKVETKDNSKQMMLINNENAATELTPLKSDISSSNAKAMSTTPDVTEFFLSIPNASTPQPQKSSPKDLNNHSETSKSFGLELDKDFQRIDWETSNDTLILNNADTSSISLKPMQTNETLNTSLKAKIEHLSVYDNPPPLSPIVMSLRNNCRPSGLRRSRRIIKRT